MKKTTLLLTALVLGLGSPALAVDDNDNLSGIKLCVDDDSFTAGIGGMDATSGKVAQGLYDYFVAQAAAKKIKIEELGAQTCSDYAVALDFSATTGTPRAWYGSINVYDSTSYFSPKTTDTYKQPVSVWSSAYYGVLQNNDGLSDFLTSQGKSIIDEFLKAYLSVN
ncbi:hypothetical protein EHF33_00600 [Deinococcus psychrotolerans]|uniref:Uncharacterized protein n=1 Tax=Deinococcus psychrotolerans TaxID=2489213 RepID=A0A3G8YK57_9DEIO|nr:hypothetical protein [Deinococcus psychrotolerans]AZI41436.1 hypothetical protein EHF33_00600 [Deinococcus psychrotolerans]